MSQDSQEIKTIEQWRWSEMQGLELVSSAPPLDPFRTNPSTPINTTPTRHTPLVRSWEISFTIWQHLFVDFVVGFTAVWQLALVTLAVVPLIAVIGAIHTTTLAKLSSKSQDALSQAGNIVEQTIVQIRVVYAFVGESRALQAYSSALKVAQRLGYKSGFAKGMGLGATYFVVFCCYALLLWYGGYLVRHHYTNGGLAIATMFAVMIGGLALGQSAPSMSAFAKAKVAAAKIFRIIDHKPGIDRNAESGLELDSVSGLVELKNVDFSYPSRHDVRVLNNFSLIVPAGKTIALLSICTTKYYQLG